MSKFLKNIQHNNYLEQPITYSKYICKNCNAKNKVYEYSNDERDPKDISNIGYIDVSINDNIIYVTTPIMICPFGFNKETDILTLQFSNVKTADRGDSCASQEFDSVYGRYYVDFMDVGSKAVLECVYDNDSSITVVFSCDKNIETGLAELRPTYDCIRTHSTIYFEMLAGDVSDFIV